MGREILKKAGAAATQSVLLGFLEDRFKIIDERFKVLDERFSALHQELRRVYDRFDRLETKLDNVDRQLDARIDSLRNEILEKFESNLNLINEVSHRITKLDGRVEGFMELFGKMFEPVRLPMKRRKAG